MAFDATEDDLGNFFYQGGCDVTSVKIQLDRNTGKPKGFAHIEMANEASLRKALTAHGVELKDRKLNVDIGKPASSRYERSDNRDRRDRSDRPSGRGGDARGGDGRGDGRHGHYRSRG